MVIIVDLEHVLPSLYFYIVYCGHNSGSRVPPIHFSVPWVEYDQGLTTFIFFTTSNYVLNSYKTFVHP